MPLGVAKHAFNPTTSETKAGELNTSLRPASATVRKLVVVVMVRFYFNFSDQTNIQLNMHPLNTKLKYYSTIFKMGITQT